MFINSKIVLSLSSLTLLLSGCVSSTSNINKIENNLQKKNKK